MRFNWDYDYVKMSRPLFTFSIVVTLIGMLSLAIFGMNYGVDFSSGSNIDVSVSQQLSQDKVQSFLDERGYKDSTVIVGADRVTMRLDQELKPDQEQKFKADFKQAFDSKAAFEINTVDVEMAKELERNALLAILIASIGIVIYVSLRFEWRFAIAAIVSLLHDAFIVISVFSICRFQVNLTFIVAILTIIGYSVNDTVVIFDRVRENLRFSKTKTRSDLAKVVNSSISQTMTRSINTVLTVFIAAICLYIFGSESIRMFSLAMVIGLISGAYSSVFIATPLWFVLKGKQNKVQTAK